MGDEDVRRARVERDFQAESRKWMGRGRWLLAAAGLIWVYLLWRLVVPHEGCDVLVLQDSFDEDGGCGQADWPWLMTVLIVSLPVAMAGAILWLRGALSLRMSHYTHAMNRR